jgi:hypothetical protein
MGYWYISFATDAKFLGATVVAGTDAVDAINEATRRGINPGGEAAIFPLPEEAKSNPDVMSIFNRLADESEMMAQGGVKHADLSPEFADAFADHSTLVCQDCNEP